jgi:glycosyltransferase involved in cell wall biosynthesis
MRVGILTIAYNEERFIGPCIRQFKPFGLDHLVLLSNNPWHGDSRKPDATNDIASELGAEVICGDWESEHRQRNFGLDYFDGYDWVLIVDADEFYSPDDISLLSESLEQDAEAIVAKNMLVYWKDTSHLVSPIQEDRPIVAIRPEQRFVMNRNAFSNIAETNATVHHLSYVRSDDDMQKKIQSFSHAVDFDTEHWYNTTWKQWTEYATDLHPVNPSQFRIANRIETPEWLERLFNETT